MKRFIILAISIILSHFTAVCQEPDCSIVKNGTFKSVLVIDGLEFETIITRENNKQIEDNKAEGIKMAFDVKWTSACTYELSKPRILKGNVPGVTPDQVLYVRITAVTKESYTVEVTSNFFSEKASFDFLILHKDLNKKL